MAEVKHCDPVRSRYHLLAQIEGSSEAEVEKVINEKLKHISDIQMIDFTMSDSSAIFKKENTELGGNEQQKLVSSFILFELDRDHMSSILTNLENIPFVTACYPSLGRYDLIVEMKASSFIKLHRSLTGDIRPLEGILRCWMLNVININQL